MLNAIHTITIVNHYTEKGEDKYSCHVIYGASWYWQRKVVVDKGLKFSSLLKCRIPKENALNYINEKSFHMDDGKWTLKTGDKIVLTALKEVTGEQFAKLTQTYEGATVLAVHENFLGINPHLYIEGE